MSKPLTQYRLRLGILGGGLIVLAIGYGSLMHNPPMPNVAGGDKWLHLLGYGVLAAWAGVFFRQHWRAILLGGSFYGVLIECLQGMTDYRSFDLLDMLANALGVMLGLLMAHTILVGLHRLQRGSIP